jgi:hypothetical protein
MNELNDQDYNALLEAEPHELRGEGESEIAQRVREDVAVRRAADHLLQRMIVCDVTVSAAANSTAKKTTRLSSRRRIARATIFSSGLAAAAILALVVSHEDPAPARHRAPPTEPPMTATLNASSSRSFAVIPTDNPDIAIVWLFDKEKK